jgi:hypothetical protein
VAADSVTFPHPKRANLSDFNHVEGLSNLNRHFDLDYADIAAYSPDFSVAAPAIPIVLPFGEWGRTLRIMIGALARKQAG